MKFDNEAKVLIKTDYSLIKPNQKIMIPYDEIRFYKERGYRSDGGNASYFIYLEIPKKAPKPITAPSNSWQKKVG